MARLIRIDSELVRRGLARSRPRLGLTVLVALLGLAGCMKVSDLASGAEYHLRDAGVLDHGRTERMASRLAKGQFDMNDLRAQLQQMRRMGGLGALASMLPGMKKISNAINATDDRTLIRLDAMIGSMTPKERTNPAILNAKRKIRIAKGSGMIAPDMATMLVYLFTDAAIAPPEPESEEAAPPPRPRRPRPPRNPCA